jgi:ribonuclease Z
LHGDHIFGLPGLLLSLQVAAKTTSDISRQVVQVYGPVGIFNYIAMTLSLSCAELTWLTVEVYELQGGLKRWQHPGGPRTYPEFRHRGLIRREIPQNENGTWTISTAKEITCESDVFKSYSGEPVGEYIYAAEVQHVPKLQTFGYVFREPSTLPWNIDKDKAVAVGVKPSQKFKLLKSGFAVRSDDGSREVQPSEVLKGERAVSRAVALIGDCCYIPPPMLELCRNVDVLVHEATFLEGDKGRKVDFGGHSTAAQAGKVADEVAAKSLLLNHIASGSFFRGAEAAIVDEAKSAVKGSTKVQLSYDHLELLLPRTGLK